ncbi:hdod domain family protein [Sulfurihydrogenibium azorense Az-Fu1]|uniref:Hdod domain family protein n=1 Tax=Sulfurihydrogenibium azorense (strain DSM 15241 / OCM 825 / Az-Fu1) TaxID=204536 RepID=C1DXM7_SULAA|nr:HDOD domain-containing protein [Sulfurihydrogenibium azorense]ACN99801.1 hdod domain family protein [Sulfurihydrogenibium azorense Az-Fu1]
MILCKVPVFDDKKNLYAYEIKYEREESNLNQMIKDLYYTISQLDIKKFLSGKNAFIKVHPDVIIFTDFLNLINKEVFILEVESKYLKSKILLDKLKSLKEEGFTFSLEVSEGEFNPDTYLPAVSIFEYLSVSLKNFNSDKEKFISLIHELPFMLKAEDVDSNEDFNKALNLGFKLFEGEFFTKPEQLTTKEESFNKLEVLKLIRYVTEEDDLNDIAEAIKANPDISVALLKYVNSSFFYLANPITSINRAVIYLGRKNILSWLLLISMISVAKNDMDIEAVKMELFRGKFMELLSLKINPDQNIADTAFLVGVLSLAEKIFKVDIKTILNDLKLSQEFEKVLVERSGYFGELLNFVINIEKNNLKEVKKFKENYGLSDKEIGDITVETYKWIDTIFEIVR